MSRAPRPAPSWGESLDLGDPLRRRPQPQAAAVAAGPWGSRLRPGKRGWLGPGRGKDLVIQPQPEFRATTAQVCGLFPWSAGTSAPLVGVPLGRHLATGSTVCCDPISWFQSANLTNNPSLFALALPAMGKSTLIRRMVCGLTGFGVMPIVLGDLKPDYVALIRALGGQVISLGHGRGYLNVLDPGEALSAAQRLRSAGRGDLAEEVLADAHGRRHAMVAALISIGRRADPREREEAILDQALRVLQERHDHARRGAPVLADLLQVVRDAPEQVRAVALDRGDEKKYLAETEDLEASLLALVSGGRLGQTFSRPTTAAMRLDTPVAFDVSAIDDTETDLQAAALAACWSTGFASVNIAHALADAGLEPPRQYFAVLDELWRALGSGHGLVARVDALTRLNRTKGVGQAMISHSMSDLNALRTTEERAKARGFVERAGMVICGALPEAEMEMLHKVVPFSRAERTLITGWTSPPSWDSGLGRDGTPPGRGRFLIKVGGRPGIPLQVMLTSVEASASVHDTNQRWKQISRRGAGGNLEPSVQHDGDTGTIDGGTDGGLEGAFHLEVEQERPPAPEPLSQTMAGSSPHGDTPAVAHQEGHEEAPEVVPATVPAPSAGLPAGLPAAAAGWLSTPREHSSDQSTGQTAGQHVQNTGQR